MKNLKETFPYWFENELLRQCGIPEERFYKVSGSQWKDISDDYRKICR